MSALLLVCAGCSSGGTHATTSAASTVPVVMTPTTPALPTAVRVTKARSQCPAALSAAPTSRGVGRLDISLVPLAALRVEVCTYVGSSAPKYLHGDVVLEGVDADTFESAANGVAGIDPVSGPRCEPGDGASVLVLVSDGVGLEQLLAARAGCRGVSNGLLSGAATPTWTTVLERAVALADLCASRRVGSASCVAARS